MRRVIVVGYQLIQLGPKFNLFSATFKGVGKDLDLQEIVCTKPDGTAWATGGGSAGKCAGNVFFQKTDRDGNYGTNYFYYSTSADVGTKIGWYYKKEGVLTYAEGVKITSDDGLLIQNKHKSGAALRVSGEVELNPFIVLPPNFSITGNFTPVPLDLQEIECTKPDGTAWATGGGSAGKCAGNVFFQFADADGNYGTNYFYYSTSADVGTKIGWYYKKEGVLTYAEGVTLEPGKGILVQNKHKSGAALKLKSPVAKKDEE